MASIVKEVEDAMDDSIEESKREEEIENVESEEENVESQAEISSDDSKETIQKPKLRMDEVYNKALITKALESLSHQEIHHSKSCSIPLSQIDLNLAPITWTSKHVDKAKLVKGLYGKGMWKSITIGIDKIMEYMCKDLHFRIA